MIITLPKVWRQVAHLQITEFAVALLSDNVGAIETGSSVTGSDLMRI